MIKSELVPAAALSWEGLRALVMNAVSSPHTQRLYGYALDRFQEWYFAEPRPRFSKGVVLEYRAELERQAYSRSTVALHLAAIRRLAAEAADNGLMDPALAAGVLRIRTPRQSGRLLGNWLTLEQAADLVAAPDPNTLKGKRDIAILAVLLGCGLRRHEAAHLSCADLQIREGRWVILDLVGKRGRIRTVPLPGWVKQALDQWTEAANINHGRLFRRMDKADRITGDSLSAQAVYEVARTYGCRTGQDLAPHDLRRTFARLAHQGDRRIEQIQLVLGHASIRTTELYLGIQQDLKRSPGDTIRLPLPERVTAG